MTQKGKFLYTETIKDYKTPIGDDIQLSVYGIFNTDSIEWSYYIISHSKGKLTSDVCTINLLSNNNIDLYNVKSGKKVKDKEEGVNYIKEFKIKWETGSNDTISEIRDKKINNIIS
jgi:hypothetical protein